MSHAPCPPARPPPPFPYRSLPNNARGWFSPLPTSPSMPLLSAPPPSAAGHVLSRELSRAMFSEGRTSLLDAEVLDSLGVGLEEDDDGEDEDEEDEDPQAFPST